MSKRHRKGTRKGASLSVKRQSSPRKSAAAKRRNVARRLKSTATEIASEDQKESAVSKQDPPARKLASKKPSQHTMRVSLKAPGVGEAKGDAPSKHTMRVSLKAPGADETNDQAPSKHTMRVSLKAPGAGEGEKRPSIRPPAKKEAGQVARKVAKISMEDLPDERPQKEQKADSTKPSQHTMRVSLKAPDAAAGSPDKDQPAARKKGKGRPKKKRGGKKTAKKQSFEKVEKSATETPTPQPMPIGNGIPKETMRVSLKASGVPKETMRVSLKAPTPGESGPVEQPAANGVSASNNPFIQNTRNPDAGLPVVQEDPQPTPAPSPSEPIAPEATAAVPSTEQKSGPSDVVMILLYTVGFLALILVGFWAYQKFS